MFENMLNKLQHIIRGNWYNLWRVNQKLYKERRKICDVCEHKKKLDGIWVCGICYCPLQSKLRVPEEECHANKWPKITN